MRILTLSLFSLLLAFACHQASAAGVTVTWEAPMTRVNGDPLPVEEIDGYTLRFYVADEMVHAVSLGRNDASTDMDNLEQYTDGLISVSLTCTDIYGLESEPSNVIQWNINGIMPPQIYLQWR